MARRQIASPDQSFGFRLWHATLRWQRALTAELAPLSLTYGQFFVLGSLRWLSLESGAPRQREVAGHCGLDAMTVSQIVRTLEGRGWLRREVDAEDARALRLGLTSKGEAVFGKAVARVREVDYAFFRPLGAGERRFGELLRKLNE
jgi:DNA-binding MarR family transcriptional regulator